ncbi:conjugal transfer protein [Streptomyces melanogenes]|uniref:conjugal transfer protein n=1 Tax=Streptomyces melanogenes TaxID=67326 RepID=UPI0037BACD95
MKLLRQITGAPAEPEWPLSEEGWEDDSDDAVEGVGGWSMGGRANTAALLRWCVWTLLIVGPLLAGAAYLSIPSGSGPVRPQAAAPAATGSQGAAGFAIQFVAAYVGAGEGDENKLAAYYPAASGLRLEGASGRRRGEQLTVVRLRQTDPDIWSVTVAAHITATHPAPAAPTSPPGGQRDPKQDAAAAAADAVRYFQVPVATAPAPGHATGYVALALPAEVAAPPRITPPALVYGQPRPALPGDPRSQAVSQFLDAYLTGKGSDLARYLAPGTQLSAISPAPYRAVSLDQISLEGQDDATATAVPGDGSRLRLLATLRATGPDGVNVPLTYALTLSARAGRWEIAALDGAPAQARARTQSPTPPAPTP